MRRHWNKRQYDEAMALMALGQGTFKVGRQTGIPRSTLRYWSLIDRPPATVLPPRPKPNFDGWRPPEPFAYCYLFGLYLGDGCVSTPPGNPRLTLSLDARYPIIVEAAAAAIRRVVPGAHVHYGKAPGCVALGCSHGVWCAAFPQAAPGRKHTRPITLSDWQKQLTTIYPKALLRGLIHSDGSRCMNRFQTKLPRGRVATYEYPRYFFTNYSEDIRRIFCDHCDLLGIRWSQSSFRNISVSHRDSVAVLDTFVGPKE